MKPQTFFRLALFLPYLLWAILALLAAIQRVSDGTWLSSPTVNFLNANLLAAIYLMGILFWFLPYTLLAVGLLIWSRNKQVKMILRACAISPPLLAIFILLEINIVSIVLSDPGVVLSVANLRALMSLNLVAMGFTLGAGYFFVALALGIYKLFQYLHIIKEPEIEIQPVVAEAI